MSERFEWYPWHAGAWATDERAQALSLAGKGLYRELLDMQFKNGSIPDDIERIARLVRAPVSEVKKLWRDVRPFFHELGDDRLGNPRMIAVMEKQEAEHIRLSAQGKRGVQVREAKKISPGLSPAKAEHDTQLKPGIMPGIMPNDSPAYAKREEKRREEYTGIANATPVVGKRFRPVVEPGPEFGAHEPVVQGFLAVVAAANKSGTIAESKAANLRREVAAMVERFGIDAAMYGLLEATRREKASTGYAIACAKGYTGPKLLDEEPEHTLPRFEDLKAAGVL